MREHSNYKIFRNCICLHNVNTAKEKDIALTAVEVKSVFIKNVNLGVLNVAVPNSVNIKYLNTDVLSVGVTQFVTIKTVKIDVKIVYIYYFVNIITEKRHVNYVKRSVHASITRHVISVIFVILLIITANIILQETIVKYVQRPLIVTMENTNHGVKNAEVHHYVNLHSVTKWPSNATTIIV